VAQPPAPTKELNDHVNKACDAIAKSIRDNAARIATDIVNAGAMEVNSQDRAIWSRLFGNLEFESRTALKAQAVAMVSSAVKQYTEQWIAYADQTKQESRRRSMEVGMKLPPAGGGSTAIWDKELEAATVEGVRREVPFTPKLTF
jgi:hypothetical protein